MGNTPFQNYFEITIPTNAVTGTYIGMRLRLSHQDNMTPYGRLESGEVEDYLIGIDCPQIICIPFENIIVERKD